MTERESKCDCFITRLQGRCIDLKQGGTLDLHMVVHVLTCPFPRRQLQLSLDYLMETGKVLCGLEKLLIEIYPSGFHLFPCFVLVLSL